MTETMTPEEFVTAALKEAREDFRGVIVNGSLSLYNATVKGNLDLSDATVKGNLDLIRATVEGDLCLSDATVEGDLYLIEATVKKVIYCGENIVIAFQCHLAFPGTPVHFNHKKLDELFKKLTD